MSMTFEEALEYIYKVVKCREQDKTKCNGCESCSYNFKFGWTYKAEKAIAQYYEEKHERPEIIHCGECKHYKIDHPKANGYHCCYRCHNIFPMKEDDFCSKAERRTDEQSD